MHYCIAIVADVSIDRIRHVGVSLHGFTACDLAIPAEDGLTLCHFGEGGRHLTMTSTLTDVVIYQFSYDGQGRLVGLRAQLQSHTH